MRADTAELRGAWRLAWAITEVEIMSIAPFPNSESVSSAIVGGVGADDASN